MALYFGKDKELEKKKLVSKIYQPKSKPVTLASIDELNKPKEIQQAVVAFDPGGNGTVLSHYGDSIYEEVQGLNSYDAGDLGLTCQESPDEGIWIWEGFFTAHCDWQGEWETDQTTLQWREPTDEEFKYIRKGDCPFDQKFEQRESKSKEPIRVTVTKPVEVFNPCNSGNVKEYVRIMPVSSTNACPKCGSKVEKKQCVSCGFSP